MNSHTDNDIDGNMCNDSDNLAGNGDDVQLGDGSSGSPIPKTGSPTQPEKQNVEMIPESAYVTPISERLEPIPEELGAPVPRQRSRSFHVPRNLETEFIKAEREVDFIDVIDTCLLTKVSPLRFLFDSWSLILMGYVLSFSILWRFLFAIAVLIHGSQRNLVAHWILYNFAIMTLLSFFVDTENANALWIPLAVTIRHLAAPVVKLVAPPELADF